MSTTSGRLEEGGALVFFSFPFSLNFQLVFAFVCVVFSVFNLIPACVLVCFRHE
jgi:hypothetical protein